MQLSRTQNLSFVGAFSRLETSLLIPGPLIVQYTLVHNHPQRNHLESNWTHTTHTVFWISFSMRTEKVPFQRISDSAGTGSLWRMGACARVSKIMFDDPAWTSEQGSLVKGWWVVMIIKWGCTCVLQGSVKRSFLGRFDNRWWLWLWLCRRLWRCDDDDADDDGDDDDGDSDDSKDDDVRADLFPTFCGGAHSRAASLTNCCCHALLLYWSWSWSSIWWW